MVKPVLPLFSMQTQHQGCYAHSVLCPHARTLPKQTSTAPVLTELLSPLRTYPFGAPIWPLRLAPLKSHTQLPCSPAKF